MISLLITALKRLNDNRRRRALLHALLAKDDRVLEDIGLRRADIIEALGTRGVENPRDYARKISNRSLALDGLR